MIYLGDKKISSGSIGVIENVDLTPTNAFYTMDCAAYAQKYFSPDYPNVIVYNTTPLATTNFDCNFYHPYDCKRVVINGVEHFNVVKGTPFQINTQSLIMYCFDNTDNTKYLEGITDETVGNKGNLTEVYCNGINVTGWSELISKNGATSTHSLRRLIIKNNKTELLDSSNFSPLSTNLDYFYLDGVKTIHCVGKSLFSGKVIICPDLEELDNEKLGYLSTNLASVNHTFFKIPFEVMFPNLRVCTLTPINFATWDYGEVIIKHDKVQKLWGYNYPTTVALTKANFDNYYWEEFNFPNCTDVRVMFGTSNTRSGAVKSMKFGKLTNLAFDTSLVRGKFLQNLEVGQDTDINLDIRSFTGGYVFDTTFIDDTKTEALKVLSNVRNGLLNKVADHSTDGQTRTITLTTMVSNMSGCNIPEVVAEMESIINEFNRKGWTVL